MAWEKSSIRYSSIAIIAVLVSVSVFFGYKLVMATAAAGFVATHFTVYLGMDKVMPSGWIAGLILIPIVVISTTNVLAYTIYRLDAIAAKALLILSALSSLIWLIHLYYLLKINT